MKLGFRPLARAAEVIELSTGGLCAAVANLQSKRELYRLVIQATLDAIRVIVTQKEKTVAVLMKQLALSQDEASFVYDALQKGWALDGKPTPGALKLELEMDQKDAGLKELPKAEQMYDFALLDEVAKR